MSRLVGRAGDLPTGTQLVREPGLELGSAQPQTELLDASFGCLLTKRGLEGLSPCATLLVRGTRYKVCVERAS